LGIRRGHSCGRGAKIGLLLGRIEPGQDIAGIDMVADVHKPLKDASADPERQVGTEARLDLAGQRYGSLSVPWLHKLGVHHRATLEPSGGVVIAGAKRRRQQGEREYGTHRPRNSRRGRVVDGMVHGGSPG
jgi:hypothetical protein